MSRAVWSTITPYGGVTYGTVGKRTRPGRRARGSAPPPGCRLVPGDHRHAVGGGRLPGAGVGLHLVAGADVLNRVRLAGEPHVRDAAPLGVADLLAELRRRRGHLGGDAAGPQPGGDPV